MPPVHNAAPPPCECPHTTVRSLSEMSGSLRAARTASSTERATGGPTRYGCGAAVPKPT